jgi:hypothetical protein
MYTEEEHASALGGVTVKEAHIALQLLDKANSHGVINPIEYTILGEWRKLLTDAIQRSLGKDHDETFAVFKMAQQQEMKDAQDAAQAAAAPTQETV